MGLFFEAIDPFVVTYVGPYVGPRAPLSQAILWTILALEPLFRALVEPWALYLCMDLTDTFKYKI